MMMRMRRRRRWEEEEEEHDKEEQGDDEGAEGGGKGRWGGGGGGVRGRRVIWAPSALHSKRYCSSAPECFKVESSFVVWFCFAKTDFYPNVLCMMV